MKYKITLNKQLTQKLIVKYLDNAMYTQNVIQTPKTSLLTHGCIFSNIQSDYTWRNYTITYPLKTLYGFSINSLSFANILFPLQHVVVLCLFTKRFTPEIMCKKCTKQECFLPVVLFYVIAKEKKLRKKRRCTGVTERWFSGAQCRSSAVHKRIKKIRWQQGYKKLLFLFLFL